MYVDDDQELPRSQASEIMAIEDTVKTLERFINNEGGLARIDIPHRELAYQLPSFLRRYDTLHDYSEYVQLFWDACSAVGLLDLNKQADDSWMQSEMTDSYIERVFRLVEYIALGLGEESFRRHAWDRRYQNSQMNNNLREFAAKLFQRYRRVLSLRVDLHIPRNRKHLVTIDDFYEFIDRLIAMREAGKGVISKAIGYAISLEQARYAGFHAHALILLDGSQHWKDIPLARSFGEEWNVCSNGLGSYFSVNGGDLSHFEQNDLIGVGMIHRDDPIECANGMRVAAYLRDDGKEDQHLRIRPKGRKTISTSRLPV